jgi:hypothetical protein
MIRILIIVIQSLPKTGENNKNPMEQLLNETNQIEEYYGSFQEYIQCLYPSIEEYLEDTHSIDECFDDFQIEPEPDLIRIHPDNNEKIEIVTVIEDSKVNNPSPIDDSCITEIPIEEPKYPPKKSDFIEDTNFPQTEYVKLFKLGFQYNAKDRRNFYKALIRRMSKTGFDNSDKLSGIAQINKEKVMQIQKFCANLIECEKQRGSYKGKNDYAKALTKMISNPLLKKALKYCLIVFKKELEEGNNKKIKEYNREMYINSANTIIDYLSV